MKPIKLILLSALFAFALSALGQFKPPPDVGEGKPVGPINWGPAPTPSKPEPVRNPPDPAIQQLHQEAEQSNNLGVEYYNNGQWSQAIEAFNNAKQKWPDKEMFRSNHALAVEGKRRFESSTQRTEDDLRRLLNDQRQTQMRWQLGRPTSRPSTPNDDQARRQRLQRAKQAALQQMGGGEPLAEAQAAAYYGPQEETKKIFDIAAGRVAAPGGSIVDLTGMGQRPDWGEKVKKDKEFISLQKEQDRFLEKARKSEAVLEQIRKEMATAPPEKRAEMAVKAVDAKAAMLQAQYDANRMEGKKRECAKRVVSTVVE